MARQTNSISQTIVCGHCKGSGYLQRRRDLLSPPDLDGDRHPSQWEAIVNEVCLDCRGYGRFFQCPICLGQKIVTYRPNFGAPTNWNPSNLLVSHLEPHHSHQCKGCDGKGIVTPPRLAALKNLKMPGEMP